jgi:NAD(P) transhydrogenase subunit alpha
VAATPETVKRLIGLGCQVQVEQGAGAAAGYADAAYGEAGGDLFDGSSDAASERWGAADVLLAVQAPAVAPGAGMGLAQLRPGALVMGLLDPFANRELVAPLMERQHSAIALELLPRISRAQAMDALSSQANIAGYKAALQAAAALDRFFPMLMTAAGTVQPAKVVVLGAGVAGLQAVATARRLGALVKVSDVRPAAREQVESLGARFIEPPVMEQSPGESGGYAEEAGAVFLEAQRQLLAPHLAEADVVITTALVPGSASAPVDHPRHARSAPAWRRGDGPGRGPGRQLRRQPARLRNPGGRGSGDQRPATCRRRCPSTPAPSTPATWRPCSST